MTRWAPFGRDDEVGGSLQLRTVDGAGARRLVRHAYSDSLS
jgi:hypothetical protein